MAALLTVFATVLGVPSRASAHGAAGDDATNYRIDITAAGHAGLRWQVYGDAQIELTNATGGEVIVAGYRGEPFLRFAADGNVYENRRSPATYLNADRYGVAEVPPGVDAAAPAEWALVDDDARFAWHDHRIHWMSPSPPPEVAADRSREHLVFSWVVPVTVDGSPVEVRGDLRWIPPVPWWPPIVATAALFLVVTVVAARMLRPRAGRWRGLGRTTAVLVWVVLAANVVRTVDDMLAVPASTSEQIWIAAIAVVTVAVTVALSLPAWSGRPIGFAGLAIAGLATMLSFGGESHPQLHRSQLVTELAPWIRRWTVAASYTIIVATCLAAALAGRWYARSVVQSRPRSFASPLAADDASGS